MSDTSGKSPIAQLVVAGGAACKDIQGSCARITKSILDLNSALDSVDANLHPQVKPQRMVDVANAALEKMQQAMAEESGNLKDAFARATEAGSQVALFHHRLTSGDQQELRGVLRSFEDMLQSADAIRPNLEGMALSLSTLRQNQSPVSTAAGRALPPLQAIIRDIKDAGASLGQAVDHMRAAISSLGEAHA
jgi:t-SNARE complex subunit (syntaxin)